MLRKTFKLLISYSETLNIPTFPQIFNQSRKSSPSNLFKYLFVYQGPQELSSLSTCALQYFFNTPYEPCATALMVGNSCLLLLFRYFSRSKFIKFTMNLNDIWHTLDWASIFLGGAITMPMAKIVYESLALGSRLNLREWCGVIMSLHLPYFVTKEHRGPKSDSLHGSRRIWPISSISSIKRSTCKVQCV